MRLMKSYINKLAEISKDEKCHSCVSMQSELRVLLKETEDWRLQEKISQLLRDHDLHYHPGCDECGHEKAREEFEQRNGKV
jgi:hypothetical protein